MPARRGEPPLWKKLLFALVPLLALGTALEVGWRLLEGERDGRRFSNIVEDEELGWRLAPGETGAFRTNGLGMRDDPLDEGADLRVLLLGDSVSWGDGVLDTEEIYPRLLEQMLNARGGGLRVDVLNASVPGYSTFQLARYLELRGLALKPDLVVLQFCLNDVVERYTTLAQYGGPRRFLGVDTRVAVSGLHGWLLRHSRLYEGLTRAAIAALRHRETYAVENLASDRLPPALERAWARTATEIDSVRRLTAERGIPLVIVIAPYRFQLADPDRTDQPQRRLAGYSRQHGVPAVDLLPAFVRLSRASPGAPLFIDENHFSPLGHRAAAQELYAPVARQLGALLRARGRG